MKERKLYRVYFSEPTNFGFEKVGLFITDNLALARKTLGNYKQQMVTDIERDEQFEEEEQAVLDEIYSDMTMERWCYNSDGTGIERLE